MIIIWLASGQKLKVIYLIMASVLYSQAVVQRSPWSNFGYKNICKGETTVFLNDLAIFKSLLLL